MLQIVCSKNRISKAAAASLQWVEMTFMTSAIILSIALYLVVLISLFDLDLQYHFYQSGKADLQA